MICPICNRIMKISYTSYTLLLICRECELIYSPSSKNVYDDEYLLHYKLYKRTEFSKLLQKARWDFIGKNIKSFKSILDYGCGSDAFLVEATDCMKDQCNLYSYDPYFMQDHKFLCERKLDITTFFDSLEHMNRLDIISLLNSRYIVISIPILEKNQQLFEWKHFRPNEHIWYFTEDALIKLMTIKFNYKFILKDDFETQLGRDCILTFLFEKRL